jgi:hypothetical protein
MNSPRRVASRSFRTAYNVAESPCRRISAPPYSHEWVVIGPDDTIEEPLRIVRTAPADDVPSPSQGRPAEGPSPCPVGLEREGG